jgi:translation elongation factor EF-Tu-like GTPase
VPELVGRITHYFPHVNAGVIELERGELRVGDTVHIRGHTTDFYQRLEHMEVDHRPIELARPGQSVGIQVAQRVREHDQVFRVSK